LRVQPCYVLLVKLMLRSRNDSECLPMKDPRTSDMTFVYYGIDATGTTTWDFQSTFRILLSNIHRRLLMSF
jgi:hypothetical protein